MGTAAVLGAVASTAPAQVVMNELPAKARGLEVVERLGEKLPPDLTFVNSQGDTVALGSYFAPGSGPGGTPKPAVIAMVYYSCETACSVVLAKMTEAFRTLEYQIGPDYRVLVFGFKTEEGVRDSSNAKIRYLEALAPKDDGAARQGWQFHTGDEANCRALSDALGFPYRRLENGEYSHPIAIMVATPDGRIARYLFGFDYDPATLKMALLEASNGEIASSVADRVRAFCYMWDPAAGAYTLQAWRVMQIGGVVSMVTVGSLIGGLLIHQRAVRRRSGAGAGGGLSSSLGAGATPAAFPGAAS